MPKKKNYEAPRARQELPAGSVAELSGQAFNPNDPGRESPNVDMVALLGPDAEFSSIVRTVVLRPQLGRGIDEWVWATSAAIKALLIEGRSTSSAKYWRDGMLWFFDFLTQGVMTTHQGVQLMASKPATPAELSPLHVAQFEAYLKKRSQERGGARSSARLIHSGAKTVLLAMFSLGYIPRDSHRYFKRGVFGRGGETGATALSDAEQERLATAIKEDLSAIHHGRLQVTLRELQALRLLVVAHRMGHNLTPLLNLARDAMRPGLVPGTVLIKTTKPRAMKVTSQVGSEGASTHGAEDYLPFGLAEGAVIHQALSSTEHMVATAPKRLRNRVWLFEMSKTTGAGSKGDVTCLTSNSLVVSIKALVKRHGLSADDGQPLVVNTSRLRKSRFDRAFRLSDGDVAITANLLGNEPAVAAINYPSMNMARQVEAAGFMNEDYIEQMRSYRPGAAGGDDRSTTVRVVPIQVAETAGTATPIAGCADTLGGQHAPKTGQPCDRFVMCLFCSSFAIVGTVDELWRLFSFQAFARVELAYLEERLGPLPNGVEAPEDLLDLRDRYRLAIPYIDAFTAQQFAPTRIAAAREKAAAGLHPFWTVHMQLSRRARLGVLADADLVAAVQGTSMGEIKPTTSYQVESEKGGSYGT